MRGQPIVEEPSSCDDGDSSSSDEADDTDADEMYQKKSKATPASKSGNLIPVSGGVTSISTGNPNVLSLDLKSTRELSKLQGRYAEDAIKILNAGRVLEAETIHISDPHVKDGPSSLTLLLNVFNELPEHDKRFVLIVLAVMLILLVVFLLFGSSTSIKTVGITAAFAIFAKMVIQWMSHHEKEIVMESMHRRNKIVKSVVNLHNAGQARFKDTVLTESSAIFNNVLSTGLEHKKIDADMQNFKVSSTTKIHVANVTARTERDRLTQEAITERHDMRNKAKLEQTKQEKQAEVRRTEIRTNLEKDRLRHEVEEKEKERKFLKAMGETKLKHEKELAFMETEHLALMRKEERELDKMKTKAEIENKRLQIENENQRHTQELNSRISQHKAELNLKLKEEQDKLDFEKKKYEEAKALEDRSIFGKIGGFLFGN